MSDETPAQPRSYQPISCPHEDCPIRWPQLAEPTSRSRSQSAPPTLSAALIVRDEARHLRACLQSVQPVVDEIVVVDTGSTDGSIEIAREEGAVVLRRDWEGSFSTARNAAVDAAGGDWILYIDADERLEAPATKAEMTSILEAAESRRVGLIGVRFTLVSGHTQAHEWRLWQNDPDLRFEGIIHETIAPVICNVLRKRGNHYEPSNDVVLVHRGYDGDQMRKHLRNLPLLRAELERNPDRPYIWNHLGRVLDALGEPEEARAMWERAIDLVRERGSTSMVDSASYSDLLIRAAERGEDEPELLAEALERFPGHLAIRWAAAVQAYNRSEFEEATSLAESILRVPTDQLHQSGVTYSENLLTDWPYSLIAMCRLAEGRFEEAGEAYEKAYELSANEEYEARGRAARRAAHTRIPDGPGLWLPLLGGGDLVVDAEREDEVLLVFVDPDCYVCELFLGELNRLDATQVVVVCEGDDRDAERLGLSCAVAVERTGDVRAALGIEACPAAVRVGDRGRVAAGPVTGRSRVLELVGA